MKKYLTLLAGAMFLTACSNDEDVASSNGYQPSTNAIAFTVNEDGMENATRASGIIFNDDEMRKKEIGVFASYTGKLKYENTTVSPDFMYNQKLVYDGTDDVWTYAPVKYWPNGLAETPEYLSFFAYAPYEAAPAEDKCITDISDNNLAGDPWIVYRLAKNPWDVWDFSNADQNLWAKTADADQVDLLYATKREGTAAPYTYKPWTDVSKYAENGTIGTNIDDKVHFTMKHALACVGNEITIKTSGELNDLINGFSDIIIEGIKIEYKDLTTKARLVLNSKDGSANWKEIISGELTTTRTYLNMFKDADKLTFDGTKSADASITPASDPQHIHYLNKVANYSTDPKPNEASIEGDGIFYIPMQVAGTPKATAKVTLFYRVHILSIPDSDPTHLKPQATEAPAEASATFDLKMDDAGAGMEGKKQGIALTLGKDYDLLLEVWTLGGTATKPSYSRKW